MRFDRQRKKQLGIKSLGEMVRDGDVSFEIDESLFVHGSTHADCLVDKWARGEVLGLIAGSGVGKTEWTLGEQITILKNNPEEIAIFVSLEMKTNKLAQRLKRICNGDYSVLDRFFIISNYDDEGRMKNLTSEGILREANMYRNATGSEICCIAIDHLHVMKSTSLEGNDINNKCQSVKNIAVELNAFAILLSQTTKGKSGMHGDLPLDADASFNCSQFKWIASWVITLHQPLARVQSMYKMPILAWAYMKIREKFDDDAVIQGEFQLLYYEMKTGRLRELSAEEMITFSAAHGQVQEMMELEEKQKGSGTAYNTRVQGRAISDRERMLGDTYAQEPKQKEAKSFRRQS